MGYRVLCGSYDALTAKYKYFLKEDHDEEEQYF